jgi:LmbE family N-acetylglucosaminyl deacetylase
MLSLPEMFASASRVLIVAAHPDDETIGAAGLIQRLLTRQTTVGIVHLTDGAVRESDANYSETRRLELQRALGCLPQAPEQLFLRFSDQDLSFRLVELVASIASVVDAWQPSMVVTHPYEGGHPDHDAAALAVWIAGRRVTPRPAHAEFTSYHFDGQAMRTGRFLTVDDSVVALPLEACELATKQRMLATFVSQQETLRWFQPVPPQEHFRPAPSYDFHRPPHDPPLFYDFFQWGIGSAEWGRRAAELLEVVDDREMPCP